MYVYARACLRARGSEVNECMSGTASDPPFRHTAASSAVSRQIKTHSSKRLGYTPLPLHHHPTPSLLSPPTPLLPPAAAAPSQTGAPGSREDGGGHSQAKRTHLLPECILIWEGWGWASVAGQDTHVCHTKGHVFIEHEGTHTE